MTMVVKRTGKSHVITAKGQPVTVPTVTRQRAQPKSGSGIKRRPVDTVTGVHVNAVVPAKPKPKAKPKPTPVATPAAPAPDTTFGPYQQAVDAAAQQKYSGVEAQQAEQAGTLSGHLRGIDRVSQGFQDELARVKGEQAQAATTAANANAQEAILGAQAISGQAGMFSQDAAQRQAQFGRQTGLAQAADQQVGGGLSAGMYDALQNASTMRANGVSDANALGRLGVITSGRMEVGRDATRKAQGNLLRDAGRTQEDKGAFKVTEATRLGQADVTAANDKARNDIAMQALTSKETIANTQAAAVKYSADKSAATATANNATKEAIARGDRVSAEAIAKLADGTAQDKLTAQKYHWANQDDVAATNAKNNADPSKATLFKRADGIQVSFKPTEVTKWKAQHAKFDEGVTAARSALAGAGRNVDQITADLVSHHGLTRSVAQAAVSYAQHGYVGTGSYANLKAYFVHGFVPNGLFANADAGTKQQLAKLFG